MREREFQQKVIRIAQQYGWRVYHTPRVPFGNGRYATPTVGDTGFPDLILARGRRLIFAELKADSGKLRPNQRDWLHTLAQTGAECYLWRPKDLPTIYTLLAYGSEHDTDTDRYPLMIDSMGMHTHDAIIPNLLHQGRITILAGMPTIGKTYFTLELAYALTVGENLWGEYPLKPTRVLWLNFEHPITSLKHILVQHYRAHELKLCMLECEPRRCSLNPETYPQYQQIIQQVGVRVVIVDTLMDFIAPPLTGAPPQKQLLRNLVSETGVALLATHPTNKASARKRDPDKTALYEHHRWAPLADTIAVLHPTSKQSRDRVNLTIVECPEGMRIRRTFLKRNARFIPRLEP